MKLADVVKILRSLAPESLAEDWDKVGLQVGDPAQRIRRAMLCIDLTQAVLAEAIKKRVNLIVAYHPPIFEPLTGLTTRDPKQRMLRSVVQHNIAIYSPHTALDASSGGPNDWLIEALGKGKLLSLAWRPEKAGARSTYSPQKIVTFVPRAHVDRVREAMASENAGMIGDYTNCSFTSPGEGTFKGGPTTKPRIGKAGRLERVEEVRLEMICWPVFTGSVLRALKQAHPYETPAIDVYDMVDLDVWLDERPVGLGRLLRLDRPITLEVLVQRVKRRLGVKRVEVAAPMKPRPIRRLGVCVGAGGSLLKDKSLDAFVTGEMRHHDVLNAVERGTAVILAGHTQTERPYLPVYRQRIIRAGAGAVDWTVSKADHEPGRVL